MRRIPSCLAEARFSQIALVAMEAFRWRSCGSSVNCATASQANMVADGPRQEEASMLCFRAALTPMERVPRQRKRWKAFAFRLFLPLPLKCLSRPTVGTTDELNSTSEEPQGERYAARPVVCYAGLRICPATLLISSLRSASSVLPATQETAFDSRQMVLPAGMFTVSSEL